MQEGDKRGKTFKDRHLSDISKLKCGLYIKTKTGP